MAGALTQGFVKSADADYATPVSASDSLEIVTPPAPGLKGPKGLAPRTNYSRVHTAPQQTPDAGASAQKSVAAPPVLAKVGSLREVTMARDMVPGPSLQEMLESARTGAYLGMHSTKLAAEAAEMLGKRKDEDDEDEDKKKDKEKLSGAYVDKLAAAARFAIQQLQLEFAKQAEALAIHDQAGGITPARSSTMDGPPVVPSGHAATKPPMGPAKEGTPEASAATHNQTDYTARPGGEEVQQVPGGAKQASLGEQLRAFAQHKVAADGMTGGVAGSAGSGGQTPERWDGSQAGPPAKDKDKVPSDAAGVQAFKPRDGKETPKQEAAQLFDEPMMSRSTDGTLHNAFAHTEEAGAKVSHLVKRAAGKALLSRIAQSSRRA